LYGSPYLEKGGEKKMYMKKTHPSRESMKKSSEKNNGEDEKDTSITRTGIPQCQYTSTALTHAIYIHVAPPTCSIIHNGALLPSIIQNTLSIYIYDDKIRCGENNDMDTIQVMVIKVY